MKKKMGKNRGIWCGKVLTEPTYCDNGTGQLLFYIEVEERTKRGDLIDKSKLPVKMNPEQFAGTEFKIEVGRFVFIRGQWRTRDVMDDGLRNKMEQNIFVEHLEVHDNPPVNTRNKLDFRGVLVKKLFELERDENGSPVIENGKLVPKLFDVVNESGKVESRKKYATRKNKDGMRVNDITIALNSTRGADYVHFVAFRKLAKDLADLVEVGAEVEGTGYIRSRSYIVRGEERTAYEGIVTQLSIKTEQGHIRLGQRGEDKGSSFFALDESEKERSREKLPDEG